MVRGRASGGVVIVANTIPFTGVITGFTVVFWVDGGYIGDVVAAVAGVLVGTVVLNVYWTAVVETLTGAIVATCSGAIYIGRNGRKYSPAAIRYPADS